MSNGVCYRRRFELQSERVKTATIEIRLLKKQLVTIEKTEDEKEKKKKEKEGKDEKKEKKEN